MARRLIGILLLLSANALLATIGNPCQSKANCGTEEMCVKDFPQGYCIKYTCSTNHACDASSKCVEISDDGYTVCLKKCSQNSDCRSGYRCYEGGVCLP